MNKIETTLTSLEVAEMIGKNHKDLLRDIRRYAAQLGESKIAPTDFFKESTYTSDQNKELSCYDITKKGCEFVSHKLTGVKGTEFTAKYINRFHDMEDRLIDQANPVLPNNYIQALEQLLISAKENERLVKQNEELTVGIDRYQRFLCEKTKELKKSELAVKLDVSPQRLASRLKSIGVYTAKSSKVSQDFLDKYPGVKIIIEHEVTYAVDGEEHRKVEWQWTHEGAKAVVDELIASGMVEFTENEGFKLK